MKKVILFGNIPLGVKILKLLLKKTNISVEGVVCEKKSQQFRHHEFYEEGCVYDYAIKNNIKILETDDILHNYSNKDIFLGISARNATILKTEIIDKFEKGIVNCHGGPLPQYRGVNSANYAILHNLNKFAGTIHYMTSEIDTGPIIGRKWFKVNKHDTVHDVFCKVELSLYKLIEENIDNIIEDKEVVKSQKYYIDRGEKVGYYNKNSINKYKKVDINSQFEEIYKITRAFDFPGKEPAFFEKDGVKIYLKTDYIKRVEI